MSQLLRKFALVNLEQENTLRDLFESRGWGVTVIYEGDGGQHRAEENITEDANSADGGTAADFVGRDESQAECPFCFCQPCVTTFKQGWLGVGQAPTFRNAGIRKRIYKKYWTMLDRRGAWRDDRYLTRKTNRMLADGCVVTRREIMPFCVIRQARALYPNPHGHAYNGHHWQ